MSEFETVIGLEVHVQLNTQSKLFSSSPTTFGAKPNTQASVIDLGLPGVLPVLNEEALRMAVAFGLSIDAQINHASVFARKNYFYPDLPKGYQISQFDEPIVKEGTLSIVDDEGATHVIPIVRAHLEEDAGKSLHEGFVGASGIDLNRAGIPLLEVVSAPALSSAKMAVRYLKTLHALVKSLKICTGHLQQGAFRVDANVSVRPTGTTVLGTRTEIKNINSFRFVERAILYEAQRQILCIKNGGTIVQETRLYDPAKDETRSMRSKEDAHDYRYFSDPDLLPVHIESAWIENIRSSLPELPAEKKQRFIDEHELNNYDASVLTADPALAEYFEKVLERTSAPAKIVSNWVSTEVLAWLNKHALAIEECPLPSDCLSTLLSRIQEGKISGKIAKALFEQLWETPGDVDALIESQGLSQVSDTSELMRVIDEIIAQHPTQQHQYREGKEKLFGFFVGQIMKATKGRANPELVNRLLKEKL